MPRGDRLTTRPLRALFQAMDPAHAPFMEKVRFAYDYTAHVSDFGRVPAEHAGAPLYLDDWTAANGDLCQHERIDEPSVDRLLALGLPGPTIAHVNSIRAPRQRFWFVLRCGPHTLFGEEQSLSLIRLDEPDTIYRDGTD